LEERNIRQILKRYLLGNADERDINAVDNWYGAFDRDEAMALSPEEADATKQEIWDRIQPVLLPEKRGLRGAPGQEVAIGVEGAPGHRDWGRLRVGPGLRAAMKVAAMVILIAGAAGVYLGVRHHRTGQGGAIAYSTISTRAGERKTVTIADGSRLSLDAGTTIRVENDFSKDRKIELMDGQVFMDVKKDEQRPFIVTSEGLTTTVLGTSFTISAYKALNKVSVGVISGKISVTRRDSTLSVLEKDQELVYDKRNSSWVRIPLDEGLTAWRDGRLLLNDLSFAEMAAIMQKNYGIIIDANSDFILHTRYTTELLTDMSPEEAAEVLAAIHNLRMRVDKNENKIIFYR
jgi:transmembrane sensor